MADGTEEKSKRMLAGLLGILIGWTGAHRFVIGDSKGGILRLVISVLTCGAGSIIGFIEGIIYITKTDADFDRIYIKEGKQWF